jgi:hypothetical protein
MGGGLMQLVAYGAQDVYLTGNPQITFFKVVYRRHTNFAIESIRQTFNGVADVGKNVTCIVSRNGDLVHKMYVRAVLPAVTVAAAAEFWWTDKVGLALLKNVELEIGGQRIDKHYGDWMNIWNELSLSESKQDAYNRLVGGTTANDTVMNGVMTGAEAGDKLGEADGVVPEIELNIPLEFWFCRNPGLALPLIALQYHEVKINIEFNTAKWLGYATTAGSVTVGGVAQTSAVTATNLVGLTNMSLVSCELWADYIYLDTDERRKFAQVSHEYLIEQLQFTGEQSTSSANTNLNLTFNHPVKELVWVAQPAENKADNAALASGTAGQFDYQSYRGAAAPVVRGTSGGVARNAVNSATLKLNGHDRMETRTGTYFNVVQPWQHHERAPTDLGINVYSFGLKPEEHQPSGTCNFSRIDTATLNLSLNVVSSMSVRVYAVNYNVLRVMSGMGGLAYSN